MKPELAAASAIRGANRSLEAADLRLPEAGREPGVMHVPLPTLHRLLHPSALIGRNEAEAQEAAATTPSRKTKAIAVEARRVIWE